MDIGRAMRWFRQQQGISQGDVAMQADCSVSYLSLLENGKRDPTIATVKRIAGALQVPVGMLFLAALEPAELGDMDGLVVEKLRQKAVSPTFQVRDSEVAHG